MHACSIGAAPVARGLFEWCFMFLPTPTILLVAPDDALRHSLQALASELSFHIAESSKSTLSRFFEHSHPVLVLIGPDVARPWDALHLTRLVRQWSPRVPVAVVTSKGSEDLAVAAMRAGVNDYFKTPIRLDDLKRGIGRLLGESDRPDRAKPNPGRRRRSRRIASSEPAVRRPRSDRQSSDSPPPTATPSLPARLERGRSSRPG